MAYPMSRAVPETDTVPLPTSPVVWAGYVLKTLRACVAVACLWVLAVAMLGFFSPFEIALVFEDAAHFVPALLFVIGLVGALVLGSEIGKDFKHVLGYGVLKRSSEHHGHTVVTQRGRRLAYAAALTGQLMGCVVAASIRAVTAHWLEFLLLAGLAIVLLVPAIKFLRLANIMWRKAIEDQHTHRDIMAGGEHSLGTVVAVTNERFIVDNRAMFHVDLQYRSAGRLETVRVRFFDYPVFSPAVGNEFDVWFDPERPFVLERILIERRYVGQEFMNLADEPVPGVRASDADVAARPEPASDGTAMGRNALESLGSASGVLTDQGSGKPALNSKALGMFEVPQWMSDEHHSAGPSTPQAARRTRILIGVPPNLIAILAFVGTLLVPLMIQDVPWWTLAALWLYTALTIINAAVYWQFMLRSRWFIRSGVSFGATEAAVFAGFFAAGFAMLTTHSMVFAPLNREIPWTLAHVLIWAAVIGALLVFEWAFTSNAWALRHLNAEFPAPPEVIQEALTTHDPDGIDKLESQYGYRAGVFLYA